MKILITLLIILTSTTLFAQEEQPFFKHIKFTSLYTIEGNLQWRPFENEEDNWQNKPLEDWEEKDFKHSFSNHGIDLQINYIIDQAAFVGIGYQYHHFIYGNMNAPMNTYYIHFRTGDDFDTKFCKYIELDLGGCLMEKYFEGIMYRITLGMDFNLETPYVTPTANIYIGQRVLGNISSETYAGGFYNMVGVSIGVRIN